MFRKWLENKEGPDSRNKQGGFEPETEEQKRKWKKIDLITLPEGVSGTNCSNCRYMASKGPGVGFCTHKEVLEFVTPRMCCAEWDNKKVKRSWK